MFFTPRFVLKCRFRHKKKWLKSISAQEQAYIMERVNYYCYPISHSIDSTATCIGDLHLKGHRSVYFFDTYKYIRYFNPQLKWMYRFGDDKDIPKGATIQKARLLKDNNKQAVIMKLDKVRHYAWIKDPYPFEQKKDIVIFRGATQGKPLREKFLHMYYQHPLCNIGDTCGNKNAPQASPVCPYDHLVYKFIMCLEGNDVATNLKWVMGSNSIAVMPPPTCETWFMEGKLIADYHYISIKQDYSDLVEKITYYLNHPEKCLEIIHHAHQFVEQFKNKKREDVISLLVMEKYLNTQN